MLLTSYWLKIFGLLLVFTSWSNAGATLEDFRSNLPVVILRPEKGIGQEDWIECSFELREPGRTKKQNTLRCAVKRRGSSTVNYPKYSLNLEFQTEDGEDRDVSLLGMPEDSDWILSASYEIDRSLIRDALVFQLSNEIGLYAPRHHFVELFVVPIGETYSFKKHYMGVYGLTEKIKAGRSRVPIAKWKEGHKKRGGFIFKRDRADPGDEGFQVQGMGRFYYVYPKEERVVAAKDLSLKYALEDLSLAIQAPHGIHPLTQKHFTTLLDKRSWLTWHWINELAKNNDTYRASMFFTLDRPLEQGGRFSMGPIWDFDRSMDSHDPRDDSPTGWVASGQTGQTFGDPLAPWWGVMLNDPDFRQAHIDLWAVLRVGELSDLKVHELVDEVSAPLLKSSPDGSTPVSRNFQRWPEMPPRGGDYQNEVDVIRQWLLARLHWIDSQMTPSPALSLASGSYRGVQKLKISPKDGSPVYFTTDGNDPRSHRGAVSPSATRLNDSQFLALTSSTVVTARARRGTSFMSWSPPVRVILNIAK